MMIMISRKTYDRVEKHIMELKKEIKDLKESLNKQCRDDDY